MTTKLLSTKDCEAVMNFINSEKCVEQKNSKEVFADYMLLRNLVFNSNIIIIGDVNDGSLSKLFAVLVSPEDGGKSNALTVVAYNDDRGFMDKSIEVLRELLSGRSFTKMKIQISGEDQTIHNKLTQLGFVYEAQIKNDRLNRKIYSYFL